MNRIYQGRVTIIETLKPDASGSNDDDWQELPDWEEALWNHHALFQDAVNYYVVALLALATKPDNPLRGIRDKLAETDADRKPTDCQVWLPFRRKGVTRQGMRDSVAKYFCPDKPREEVTLEHCFRSTLDENRTPQETLDAALCQLLEACKGGGGKVRDAAVEYHPLFCNPETKANFKADKVMLRRAWAKAALPFVLHDPETRWDSTELDAFTTHSIGTPDKKTPVLSGDGAVKRIAPMLDLLAQKEKLSEEEAERLLRKLEAGKDSLEVPGYNGASVKGDANKLQMAGLVLFRHVERSERSFEVWRNATPEPPEKKTPPEPFDEDVPDDPVKVSRGERGYVFRAFTGLPEWTDSATGTPTWKEFDFAAFEEALKALHQVEEKTGERDKERGKLELRLACMENKDEWKASGESEETPPPVLAGDPRIARLEAILDGSLREEYEATEGESIAYGLNPRTTRGFRELREKWNSLAEKVEKKGQALEAEQLLDVLHDYQADNKETIGSVRLFEELIRPENHVVWKEPTDEQWEEWRQAAGLKPDAFFANDPLQALTDKRLLLRDVERLSEPIRFTPANPYHSRRLLYFSDVCDFKPNGQYKHLPNRLQVIVPMVTNDNGSYARLRVRLSYSAPRLWRDRLRSEESENLEKAPFLQPMMEALGAQTSFEQDVQTCAVSLMPDEANDGRKRHLLNFSVKLDPAEIQLSLGKQALWDKQLAASYENGKLKQLFYLYWPELKGKNDPEGGWWWARLDHFRGLGVDLGQRVAAALALMDLRANHEFTNSEGKPKPSRLVGSTGEGEDRKEWRAALTGQGLLRLPGEDAKLVTADGLQEEHYGSRGRMPKEAEWKEARETCLLLGQDADEWLGDDPRRHSFPELNDKLLVVLRRAQGRLAKLQSLSWRLKQAEHAAKAVKEIGDSEELEELLEYKEGNDANLMFARVEVAIKELKLLLVIVLVQLADRILPLRGRRWEWVEHPCSPRAYLLRQTDPGSDPRKKLVQGQRGLSLARIEQLEELRRRAQALNRTLRHVPGEKVRFGRAARGVELPDPCPDVLEKLDHVKEQRINQTAHGILAAALGVRLKHPEKDKELRRRHDVHGEYERFREPADFIVLEDLSRYLSSQGRSRRENSRLMQWCHRAILGKVKELAEPYGIPVLETNAAYSSRFCSRTGVVGFRAVELTPADKHKWFWKTQLEQASCPIAMKQMDLHRRNALLALKETFDQLDELNKDRQGKTPITLLAPMAGGPIFIPARDELPLMQADLNAAANLVLRAVAQPDCREILSRIRSKPEKEKFVVRRDSNREKAGWPEKTEVSASDESTEKSMRKSRAPNLFVDLAQIADYDQVTIEGIDLPLATGRGIFGSLREKEWQFVQIRNHAKTNKRESKLDLEEDFPM